MALIEGQEENVFAKHLIAAAKAPSKSIFTNKEMGKCENCTG